MTKEDDIMIIRKIKHFQLKYVLFCIFIISFSTLYSQDDWGVYRFDDFESDILEGWSLGDGWDISNDGDNRVLGGHHETVQFAVVGENLWSNYSVDFRLNLISGGAQINLRSNQGDRYIIAVSHNDISLKKLKSNTPETELIIDNIEYSAGYNKWLEIKAILDEDFITVFLFDSLIFEFRDFEPLINGVISFEFSENGHLLVDDVLIQGELLPEPMGDLRWKNLDGPRGGTGYDIDIHPTNPDILYASDVGVGVQKSTNGGESWYSINNGITARNGDTDDGVPIFCLTLDKVHNPDVIWAGTQYQKGIFKSSDGGESWTRKDNGISDMFNPEFRSFTISPVNPDVIYCGGNYISDLSDLSRVRGFIFKTLDGGDNWEQILDCGNLVRWIRINPTNPDVIYASTGLFDRMGYENTGVLKSYDAGLNWEPVNQGLENYSAVSGLVMHPGDPEILYACTGKWRPFFDDLSEMQGAVFKTIDGAESWNKIYEGPVNEVSNVFTTIYINPSNWHEIYAPREGMLAKSTDDGLTWTETKNGPPNDSPGGPIDIEAHPDDPSTLYIDAYAGGVFKSKDDGSTWVDASQGFRASQSYDLAFLNQDPSKLIAATHNGIYTTNDGGDHWEAHNNPRPGTPFRLAVNQSIPQVILLGDKLTRSIKKSTNSGNTWKAVLSADSNLSIEDERSCNAIKFAPTNSNVAYAGFSIGPHEIDIVLKKGPGIFKSINGGESWVSRNDGLENTYQNIMSIAVHPLNENIVYAGTLTEGVFKSEDGGFSWNRKSNGLPAVDIRALEIDPNNPETIYAGGGNGIGICKSIDGGENWQEISEGINILCPSYLLPIGGSKSSLGANLNMDRTLQNSGTYSQTLPWTKITSIAIDPNDSQIVYITDRAEGVYRSSDGGNNWCLYSEGITNIQIQHLKISADGGILYAPTDGGGIFQLVQRNYAPDIISTYPIRDSIVYVFNGDSLCTSCKAFDLNDDTLSYSWYLDGILQNSQIELDNGICIPQLHLGNHQLGLIVADQDTSVSLNWDIHVEVSTVEIETANELPEEFSLEQNIPNPFSDKTVIKYSIPTFCNVELNLYNFYGQKVTNLVSGSHSAGKYQLPWNAEGYPSGIYFYKLESDIGFVQTKYLLLVK